MATTTRKRGGAGADAGRLERVRAICLALPETTEKTAWGAPTFRVRDKMFAMFVDDQDDEGGVAIWCKAPLGVQEMLVDADPKRFFVPPYVGSKGWLGVSLEGAVDWEEVGDLLEDGYRMTAPARLAPLLSPRLERTVEPATHARPTGRRARAAKESGRGGKRGHERGA